MRAPQLWRTGWTEKLDRAVSCLKPAAAPVRFNNRNADPESHAGAVNVGGEERIKNLVRLLQGQSTPVSITESIACPFSVRFDLTVSSRVPSTSFIASMLFIISVGQSSQLETISPTN